MPALYEIRADYDREVVVVYQAFPPAIAGAALRARRFVAPFSLERMTWIKHSVNSGIGSAMVSGKYTCAGL